MWKIESAPIPADWLVFEPVRILYEFDGPRIFTLKSTSGELHLAYLCDIDRKTMRFLVVPFNDNLEQRLVAGEINVRYTLTRSLIWLFDVDFAWSPVQCWQVTLDELPSKLLPKPGVMLYPELQPVIGQPDGEFGRSIDTGESSTTFGR